MISVNGDIDLEEAIQKTGIDLGILVAEVGLWANPEVHEYLMEDNGLGAWRPGVRRKKSGEARRNTVKGMLLDDNSMASRYIKTAIGCSRHQVKNYKACHIWKSTDYPNYHTTIANLVLLPRAIESLSDYSVKVSSMLKYRAFELYDWYPEGEIKPTKPTRYPENWVNPFPFSDRVRKSLRNRRF